MVEGQPTTRFLRDQVVHRGNQVRHHVARVRPQVDRGPHQAHWDRLASVLPPRPVANAAALAARVGLYVLLGATAVATGLAAVVAWLAANWPLVLLGVAVGAVLLVPEDVYQFLTGGVSVTGVLVEKVKKFISDFMSGETRRPVVGQGAAARARIHPALPTGSGASWQGQIGAGLSSLVNRLEGLITKAKALGKYLGGSPPLRPPPPPIRELLPGAAIAAGAQVQVAQGAAVAQAGGITGKPASVQISNTITIPPIPGETPATGGTHEAGLR